MSFRGRGGGGGRGGYGGRGGGGGRVWVKQTLPLVVAAVSGWAVCCRKVRPASKKGLEKMSRAFPAGGHPGAGLAQRRILIVVMGFGGGDGGFGADQ